MVKKILRNVEVTKPIDMIFNRVIVLVVFVVGLNVMGDFLYETLIRYFQDSFVKFSFITIGSGVIVFGYIVFVGKLSITLDCYSCRNRNKRRKVYLLQIVITVILIVVIVGLIRN